MNKSLTLKRDSSGAQNRWQQCLDEARGGCRDSQAQLLEVLRPYLVRRAHNGLDTELRVKVAESDMVQEVMLQAWEGLPGFQGNTRAELIAWLHELLKNQSLETVRKYQTAQKRSVKREERVGAADSAKGQLLSTDPSPSEHAMGREQGDLVEEALRRLPASDEQVIRLRSQTELTFAEIGRILEVSEEAARKRFARATERLGRELENYAPQQD